MGGWEVGGWMGGGWMRGEWLGGRKDGWTATTQNNYVHTNMTRDSNVKLAIRLVI